MSEPHSAHSHRPAREPHQDKRSFLQKLAEFIHPGPDSKDELIETLAEAEDNHIIGAQSRAMLEGVIRMSDMTASDVMVPATRLDALDINEEFEDLLNTVIDTGHSRFPVYEGEKENEEIAEIMGITANNVRVKMTRIREKLRTEIGRK